MVLPLVAAGGAASVDQLDDPREQYKDWGQAIYLSNDDTMSLSSAQRVIFAIDKFLPLPIENIRPHELLNYFSFETAPVAPQDDFSVLADIAPDPNQAGIYNLALAVKGRPVDLQAHAAFSATLRTLPLLAPTASEGHESGLDPHSAQLRSADKLHFVDPSLATAALQAGPERLLTDLQYLGFLFESLVVRDTRVFADPTEEEMQRPQLWRLWRSVRHGLSIWMQVFVAMATVSGGFAALLGLLAVQRLGGAQFQHAADLAVGVQRKQAQHLPFDRRHHRVLRLQAAQVIGQCLQRGQVIKVDPDRVGARRAVAGAQPRPGQPALLCPVAHRSVDGGRFRPQQVTESTHERDVKDVPVPESGQLRQVVDNLGHRASSNGLPSARPELSAAVQKT